MGKLIVPKFSGGEYLPGDGFKSSSYYIYDPGTRSAIPVEKDEYDSWLSSSPKRRIHHETIVTPWAVAKEVEVNLYFNGLNEEPDPNQPPKIFAVNCRGGVYNGLTFWAANYGDAKNAFDWAVDAVRRDDKP